MYSINIAQCKQEKQDYAVVYLQFQRLPDWFNQLYKSFTYGLMASALIFFLVFSTKQKSFTYEVSNYELHFIDRDFPVLVNFNGEYVTTMADQRLHFMEEHREFR